MKRRIFDIETDGFLDPMTTIHSLVTRDVETGQIVASCTPQTSPAEWKAALADLESADEIIGHNAISFDVPAIQKIYPSFSPRGRVVDTMVATRVLWPTERLKDRDFGLVKAGKLSGGNVNRHSLEAWGQRLGCFKGDYKGPWDKWSQTMQDYCEQDTEVTLKLYRRIIEEVGRQIANKPKIDPTVALDIEYRVQTIISRQVRFGFLFDETKAAALNVKLVARKLELEETLRSAFKPWYAPRGQFTPKQNNARLGYVADATFTKVELTHFNPSSRDHIADRLQKLHGWKPKSYTSGGKPQVDESVLTGMTFPEAKTLAEYLMVQKRLGQLVEGKEALLRHVGKDRRIHGGINTCGANTFRMTHSHPNIGQVPSSKSIYGHEFRDLFCVPCGRKLVGADADALELRCLAGYMAAYDNGAYIDVVLKGKKENGTDIHSVNARVLGLDPTQKYMVDGKPLTGRDIAKVWFYAFIYGAGDQKIGAILMGGTDEKKQRSRGAASRKRFMAGLPALGTLVEKVRAKAEALGWVKGLDGRRLYARSMHAILNTLLQAAGALLMKHALVILDDALIASGLVPGVDYEFVANVHDEWQIESKEEHAEKIGKAATAAIREAGTRLAFRCPLDGQYQVGQTWNDTH